MIVLENTENFSNNLKINKRLKIKNILNFITEWARGAKMVSGYCVKCRKKQEMQNITETKLKNDRPAFYGNCPVCKTKMFRIGNLADAKKKEALKFGK